MDRPFLGPPSLEDEGPWERRRRLLLIASVIVISLIVAAVVGFVIEYPAAQPGTVDCISGYHAVGSSCVPNR